MHIKTYGCIILHHTMRIMIRTTLITMYIAKITDATYTVRATGSSVAATIKEEMACKIHTNL